MGPLFVDASMLHRWGVCHVWYFWVSVGEKKCVVSLVSAECVTYLSWVSNDGTYVWLVGVFHTCSRGSCCVVSILQSFALHMM